MSAKRRKQNLSPEERDRNKRVRDQIQSWRQHPGDPWAELERLGMTEDVVRLGWSQPRVTRAMNSVASEEKFRLKVHRAINAEGDRPLHLAGGVGRPGSPEEDHGYTRNAERALDPEAEVIDLPTLGRLQKESVAEREAMIKENLAAMREVRDVLDLKVKQNPGLTAHVGKYLWQIRSRIDECERALKRKIAA